MPTPAEAVAVSGPLAVTACAAMALSYVAILYAPALLRFPPPTSLDSYMIRRFACALVSSAASVVLTASLIGIGRFSDLYSLFGLFGIRWDRRTWRAVVFPLLLTLLVYAGSLASKLLLLLLTSSRRSSWSFGEWVHGLMCNVMA